MVGDDVNGDRVERLENSFTQFQETVQKSLQQITQTLATLTVNQTREQPNRGGPRLNKGRGNGRHHIHTQPSNYGGEDSDVEEEYEDEWEARGTHFGYRGATDFDYRQRAKDVPTFHGSMNV